MESETGARARDCLATVSLSGEKPSPDSDPAEVNEKNILALYKLRSIAAQAELPRVLPDVAEYLKKHAAAGRHILTEYSLKLLELWDILNTYKPRSILELGSGCTTAVFTKYKETATKHVEFQTVDESSTYQQAVCGDMGYEVYATVCDKYTRRFDDTEVCGYEGICEIGVTEHIDFLYVDGPNNGQAPCQDALLLMAAVPELTTIVFDVRNTTVEYTRQNLLSHAFDWHLSCRYGDGTPWYLSALRHHTVARRVG